MKARYHEQIYRPECPIVKLDRLDRKLLALLQDDASLSNAELAERVNLSTNACWRRVKRLEEEGVIRKRVALLSQETLGLGVTVFVAIKTSAHTDEWLSAFAQGVRDLPEVVEFYRLSGDTDYLLKVVVRDIQDYDRVYKKLISIAPLHDVSSSFAMERIKSSTALPLDHLA
jgi:Lrp/AsnC family transcriptional regulator